MSERHKPQHERGESLPHPQHSDEHLRSHHERELTHAEKQHGSSEHLKHIQKTIEQKAVSVEEHSLPSYEKTQQHPVLVNKHLKDLAFARVMTRTRKKLSAPSKAFSKVVHNSSIDASSEFIGKTIARPSGMMTGAIVAFIGTSLLLWITKRYGYEYNYLAVALLFVSGALLGLLGEGLVNLRRKKKHY